MIEAIKKLGDRAFWPLLMTYGLYLLYSAYEYFQELQYVPGTAFLNQLYLKKLTIFGVIVISALLLKLAGKTRMATLVLGVPFVAFVSVLLLTLGVCAFLAVLFILFGNK